MTGEKVRFVNTLMTQKTIGRIGVGPVLAYQGNALTRRLSQLAQQYANPARQPCVCKYVVVNFTINPVIMPNRKVLSLRSRPQVNHVSRHFYNWLKQL